MSTKHVILGVMSWGPGSGYSIKNEFENGGIGFVWDMSYGSIYPRLEQLAAEGLIVPIETRTEGRERTTYELTAAGWHELGRWLGEQPDYPLPWRDELLVRMIFWGTGRPDDRATLITHLRGRAARGRELQALLQVPKSPVSATDEYQGMLEDYAAMRLESELAWIEKTIAKLEGPPQPPVHDPQGTFQRAAARRAKALGGEGQ